MIEKIIELRAHTELLDPPKAKQEKSQASEQLARIGPRAHC